MIWVLRNTSASRKAFDGAGQQRMSSQVNCVYPFLSSICMCLVHFTFSTAFLEESYASPKTRLPTTPGGYLSVATGHELASSCSPSAPACSALLRAECSHNEGDGVLMRCPKETNKRAADRGEPRRSRQRRRVVGEEIITLLKKESRCVCARAQQSYCDPVRSFLAYTPQKRFSVQRDGKRKPPHRPGKESRQKVRGQFEFPRNHSLRVLDQQQVPTPLLVDGVVTP